MFASVVIPTYRRPELLGRCLAALDAQDLSPADFEIIIADDAASADTRRQVLEFGCAARTKVTYIPVLGTQGPAAARNAGWRRARGAIIAFTDDDCVPQPGWLRAGIDQFRRDAEVLAVTGQVRVPLPRSPTDYEQDVAGLERADFVTANCFCRRAALEKIGGFDARFEAAWREDSDLYFTLLGMPGKVLHAREAAVVHPVRPAPWGISLTQQRKCLFDALLYKKHPAQYRRLIQPGAPWHYYAMILALLSAGAAAFKGSFAGALVGVGIWGMLTAWFCARRLRQTSWAPSHLAEMAVTSVLIPPLSVFWRLYGAVKFRVLFW